MKTLFNTFKKNIIPLFFSLFTIFLIIFSKSNIQAVKNSINIWINNIIPSLFPFFIATELLANTNIPFVIGKLFNRIMKPIFNVPGIGAYALIMGIISGYPIGAKIITDFRKQNLCTKEEAERLIAFTNNSSPLFILSTVGITLFYDFSIGVLLLFTHILACISVGFIFRFWKAKKRVINSTETINTNISFSSLGELLSKSIFSAINSVLLIGGFIVLFGIILSMLEKTNILYILKNIFFPLFHFFGINTNFIIPFFTGIIELTNGIVAVATIPCKSLSFNIIISAFLLGFGGISIMLQVLSIISKSDISIKPYFLGKLLQGLFSSLYTLIIINSFPYFNYLNF